MIQPSLFAHASDSVHVIRERNDDFYIFNIKNEKFPFVSQPSANCSKPTSEPIYSCDDTASDQLLFFVKNKSVLIYACVLRSVRMSISTRFNPTTLTLFCI